MSGAHPGSGFPTAYRALLANLMSSEAHIDINKRTGSEVRMGKPTSFDVSLFNDWLPVPGVRKVYPKTAAAEIAWFLQGGMHLGWLRKYTKIWDAFTNEPNGNYVSTSYGHRWRNHFGRDQIAQALDTLQKDPSSRQVLVSAWEPGQDGLTPTPTQKNVPCPTHFVLSVFGNALNMTLFIRSSDVFVGLPYDVMSHALLQKAFAESLNLQTGVLHVTLAQPHLYKSHYQYARQALKTDTFFDFHAPRLPDGWGLDDITEKPDEYVMAVAALSENVNWPAFNPKPEIIL